MMDIIHDHQSMRYEVRLNSNVAFMAYRPAGEDVLDFYSTQVPPAFRGQGIAAALVKRALEDARAQGKRVIPSCSYVDVYMKRNKQYADLRA